MVSLLPHLATYNLFSIWVIPLKQKPDPVTSLLKIFQWLPWLSKSHGVKAKVRTVAYQVLPDLDPTLSLWCSPTTALPFFLIPPSHTSFLVALWKFKELAAFTLWPLHWLFPLYSSPYDLFSKSFLESHLCEVSLAIYLMLPLVPLRLALAILFLGFTFFFMALCNF